MALDLGRGARGGWSPCAVRRKFPPPRDPPWSSLASPCFFKTPGRGGSSSRSGAAHQSSLPLGFRALGAGKAHGEPPPAAPSLPPGCGAEPRGSPQRRSVRGSRGPRSPQPPLPSPAPLPGERAGPGAAGAGKGRAGAGRGVYRAARRGGGAAARLRDTGRREAARAAPGSSPGARGPRARSPPSPALGAALPAVRSVRARRKPPRGLASAGPRAAWKPPQVSPEPFASDQQLHGRDVPESGEGAA